MAAGLTPFAKRGDIKFSGKQARTKVVLFDYDTVRPTGRPPADRRLKKGDVIFGP